MNFNNVDGKVVIAGLGLVVSIVVAVRGRKRPQKIVCRVIGKTSLVKIKKEALKNIEVKFDGNPVARLGQLEVDLSNTGNEIIKTASIRFEFESTTRILNHFAKVEPPQSQEYALGFERISDSIIELTIPYLNPRKQHKQHITVTFVCDGNVDDVKVSGGAEGWSVEHRKSMRRRIVHMGSTPWIGISSGLSVIAVIIVLTAKNQLYISLTITLAVVTLILNGFNLLVGRMLRK